MPVSPPVLSDPVNVEAFLLEVADAVNTTLDLDKLLRRVAEIVKNVLDYEIFAILLLNERTQELRIRFGIGHAQNIIDTTRIKLGEGVTGQAAQRREAVLVEDVNAVPHYIPAAAGVRSELAVPLISKNKVIGVIDVESSRPGFFSPEDKLLLTLLASRIATAIENARLYTRVSRQARSLAVLNEIARDLTSILQLDDLFKHIGEQLRRLTDYQLFSVLLLDKTGSKLEHRFSLRYGERIQMKHDIPLGEGLVGYAALHQQPVVVPDVAADPRYINLNPATRSELVVPLMYKGKTIGVLDVEHNKRGYFVEQHVRTLTTLAAQIAIAIENARLYETVTRQEQQMQHDLELARELQMRLMPPERPRLRGVQVHARFQSARLIGGDLYDFVPYSRERMGVAIGDVTGKGAPAAIYAALVSGFLRSHARSELGPAELLKAINRSLTERPISAQYISMIFALWDERRRRLLLANSGLPRPIFCNQGRVETLRVEGLPLGVFPTAQYDVVAVRPQPGDMLVFFTDGITDASDGEGKMFGRTRLEQVVTDSRNGSPRNVVDAIFAAVARHAAGAEVFDDQTVLVMKFRAPAGRPGIRKTVIGKAISNLKF